MDIQIHATVTSAYFTKPAAMAPRVGVHIKMGFELPWMGCELCRLTFPLLTGGTHIFCGHNYNIRDSYTTKSWECVVAAMLNVKKALSFHECRILT